MKKNRFIIISLAAVTMWTTASLGAQNTSGKNQNNSGAQFVTPEAWRNSEDAKSFDPERNAPERVSGKTMDDSVFLFQKEFSIQNAFQSMNLDHFCDLTTQNRLNQSTVFANDPDGEGYSGHYEKKILFVKIQSNMKSDWECIKSATTDGTPVFIFNQFLYDYDSYTNQSHVQMTISPLNANAVRVTYVGHIVVRKGSNSGTYKSKLPESMDLKVQFLQQTLPAVTRGTIGR